MLNLASTRLASLVAAVAATSLGSSGSACPGDLNGDGVVGAADLAAVLASWGQSTNDINGDGIVDSADIGMLLSGWGACGPTCAGYTNLSYPGTFVGGAGTGLPPVLLIGDVLVAPDGEPQGSLTVVIDGTISFVTIAQGATSMSIDEHFVYLGSGDPVEFVLVDGRTYLMSQLFDQFQIDLTSGESPSNWGPGSRAVLIGAALVETQDYCCDLQTSLADATELSLAFWSKIGSLSLGGNVVAKASDGCEDFDNCTGDGIASFGKFDMPCGSVDPLCDSGFFLGGEATFDAVYGLWEGQ